MTANMKRKMNTSSITTVSVDGFFISIFDYELFAINSLRYYWLFRYLWCIYSFQRAGFFYE